MTRGDAGRCRVRADGPAQRAVAASLLVLAACAVDEAMPRGDVSLGAGYRRLHDSVYGRLDDQIAVRLDADVRPEGWPVWLAAGVGYGGDSYEESRRSCFLFFCSEESVTMTSSVVDLALGARWWGWLGEGPSRWWVGAGGSWVFVDLDRYVGGLAKIGDDDMTIGAYVEAGLAADTGWGAWGGYIRTFRGGSVDLFGDSGTADFDEIGVFVSLVW